MANIKTVIFYAPTGIKTKSFKNGGAEAGCRKTLAILKKAGYNVILLEKPVKKSEKKFDKILFLFVLLSTWINLIRILILNRKSIFHIAGFYLNQIYTESLFIATANFFGIKTIYEIRNGGMIEAYKSGSRTYRFFIRLTLQNADKILCQGKEYLPFIKELLNKDSVYYPNYIMDQFISNEIDGRDASSQINLLYLGRVVADKNIEFIIDICNQLKLRNINFSLHIIGGYEDEYYSILIERIKSFSLSNAQVSFLGRLEANEIFDQLKQQHFFLFPSKEKREGHSNSLTEAMGCGIVPIVSNAGFNASVVSNPLLVISEFDPSKYANRLIDIWEGGQWLSLSQQVKNRVLSNYTQSIVQKTLLNTFDTLFAETH